MTNVRSEASVEDLVRQANIEIIPLKGAEKKLSFVPAGTTVTVTCSPKFGLGRTLEHVALARKAGHRVVPHLAARVVKDTRELRDFVHRINDLGVDDLYVIGGDGDEPAGRFGEAVEILQELGEFDHDLARIGVACYPEGHPEISDESLLDALRRKQRYADYMVSQLCFDAVALARWLRFVRASGILLPLRIGIAAPVQIRKLIELSLKIGVGSSVSFLMKQHGFVGNLLLGRSYEPVDLLYALMREVSFGEFTVEGLHLFSFNQVETTVEWQSRMGRAAKTG